jgi:hypothetical protein
VKVRLLSPIAETHRTPEENLGLEYLDAESTKNGHDSDYLDGWMQQLSIGEMVENVITEKPDLIGISSTMDNMRTTEGLVNQLRDRCYSGQIVMGGVYASFQSERILNSIGNKIDGIISGEADESFQQLLDERSIKAVPGAIFQADGSIVRLPRSEACDNLDLLPLPDRKNFELVRNWKTPSHVMGSRGCYGNCTFCSVACFQKYSSSKKWRGRSPDNIVDEICGLHAMGENMVKIVADNFVSQGNHSRELEFAEKLKSKRLGLKYRISLRANDVDEELIKALKESGLFAVSLGVESFVERKLKDYEKGVTVAKNLDAIRILEKYGIYVQMGFIMFDPFVTISELEEELHNLENNKWVITKGICTKLFAADGTPITKRIESDLGFYHSENGNNQYSILDSQARNVYEALRLWASHISSLSDLVIDPISSPKNIPVEHMSEFHELAILIKAMDIAVFKLLLSGSHGYDQNRLEYVVSGFIKSHAGQIDKIRQKTIELYQRNGLEYRPVLNSRI